MVLFDRNQADCNSYYADRMELYACLASYLHVRSSRADEMHTISALLGFSGME